MNGVLWVVLVLGLVTLATVVATPRLRPRAGPYLGFCVLVWSGMVVSALPPGGMRWSLALVAVGAVAMSATRLLLEQRLGFRPPGPVVRGSLAPALVVAVVVWCLLVDVLLTESGTGRLAADLASLVLLGSVVVLVRAGGLPRAWAATAGLVGLVGVVAASVVRGAAWSACHEDKCTALGALLQGPYHSENVLGLYALLTLAAVISGWSGAPLVLGSGFCGALIYLTGSRTSIYTALALVALLGAPFLARRLGLRSDQQTVLRWGLVALPAAVTVLGIVLVVQADRSFLSGRGRIWTMARIALEGRWPTGLGLSRWAELQSVGLLPVHFAHSQVLALLFAGGVVAVVGWTAALTAVVRSASRLHARHAAPALALTVVGLTEAVWNPLTVDGFTWALVAVLLTAATAGDVGRATPAAPDLAGSVEPAVPASGAVEAVPVTGRRADRLRRSRSQAVRAARPPVAVGARAHARVHGRAGRG